MPSTHQHLLFSFFLSDLIMPKEKSICCTVDHIHPKVHKVNLILTCMIQVQFFVTINPTITNYKKGILYFISIHLKADSIHGKLQHNFLD